MNRHHASRILYLLATLTVFLLTGCGDDDEAVNDPTGGGSQPVQETIGAAGGTIAMAGTAELVIPAGALGSEIQFTMTTSGLPPGDPAGQDMVGTCVTIDPSGTNFTAPAEITIHYDEAGLGGADESDIVIYSHDGGGWTLLQTTVDEVADEASAPVAHLSAFACMVPETGEGGDGVFAVLTVNRAVMDMGTVFPTDLISARFDTLVNPCSIGMPLHPDSVSCNTYGLTWNMYTEVYTYDAQPFKAEFIVLGGGYEFVVEPSAEVPALTKSITFPNTDPHVTNIAYMDVLPLDGFTVEWDGAENGTTVFLNLLPSGLADPVISIETDNDGSHTVTAADLSGVSPGSFGLVLNRFDQSYITAEGYHPESFVVAKVVNTTLVTLGSIGGE